MEGGREGERGRERERGGRGGRERGCVQGTTCASYELTFFRQAAKMDI